jgi:hypothetical protein
MNFDEIYALVFSGCLLSFVALGITFVCVWGYLLLK